MTESESVALPLGYTPLLFIFMTCHDVILSGKILGWMVGFEPTNTGATTQGLNHLTTPTMPFMKSGDRERARTVDLQRDRLAF